MKTTLTEGHVGKLLVRFSLPFLLSAVIQTAYGAVDIFFLGRLASPESIAGVGNGANLLVTVSSLFMGLISGGMILLGQYYGAKDDKNAARTTGNIILLQGTIIVLSVTITLIFGRLLIRFMNVPSRMEGATIGADEEAWNYMRICAIGQIFNMGYGIVSSLLRSLGNSKAPLFFVAISCLTNIILDYIFIGPFNMGASGAAIATVIAQIVSFALSFIYLKIVKLPYKFSIRDIKPDRKILGTITKLGVPISLQTVLNYLSFMIIGRIINEMGLFAAAAHGIVNMVVTFYMIIPMALSAAIGAISAQNIGAGKAERALQSAKLGVAFSMVIAIPCALFASLNPTAVVSILSSDADVIKASAEFLIPFSWDCVFVGFVFVINGLFNGCGLTTFVAVHETVAAFAVRIPLSWALGRIAGATLFHVGIGTPAATFASLIMCVIYYWVKLSRGKLSKLKIVGTD